jgi:hypothetical protein
MASTLVLGLLERRTLYALVHAQQEGDEFASNSLHILFLGLTDACSWTVSWTFSWIVGARPGTKLVSRRRSFGGRFTIVIVDSK